MEEKSKPDRQVGCTPCISARNRTVGLWFKVEKAADGVTSRAVPFSSASSSCATASRSPRTSHGTSAFWKCWRTACGWASPGTSLRGASTCAMCWRWGWAPRMFWKSEVRSTRRSFTCASAAFGRTKRKTIQTEPAFGRSTCWSNALRSGTPPTWNAGSTSLPRIGPAKTTSLLQITPRRQGRHTPWETWRRWKTCWWTWPR